MLCKTQNQISPEKIVKGIFTNSDENGFLYLNLKKSNKVKHNIINEFLDKLNNKSMRHFIGRNNRQSSDLKIGEVYAAVFTHDGLFYRAKLTKDLDIDKVVVNFIDYGNSEIVSKTDLEILPDSIRKIEPLVIICVVPNIRLTDKIRFTSIIDEISQFDTTVTVEGRCFFGDDLSLWNYNSISNDVLHLISFEYNNQPIQSYLIDNGVAVAEMQAYQLINNGSSMNESVYPTVTDMVNKGVEYTKFVVLIHVNSAKEFFVHEFHKEVKNKLENIEIVISRVVETYKSKIYDNFFNKRNVYLTQFDEDHLWYRCKITKFEPSKGFLVEFLDFGNSEYKEALSDLILLTADMGEDVCYLMNEEPVAHKCQLSPSLICAFPSDANMKKYFVKKYVETSKKVVITYNVKKDNEIIWYVTNMIYQNKNLIDLVKLHFIIKESPQSKSRHSESVASSHSVHDAADVKVANYLLNGCNDIPDPILDTMCTMQNDRTYLVTHVGGINDIWIDIGDGQTREMVKNLLVTSPTQFPVSEVVIDYVYGVRVAGEDTLYRCRAVDVCDNCMKVHLLDKGTFIKVEIDDIFNISSEIIALPQQVLRFQLQSNLRLRSEELYVIERLRSLIETQYVRIVRELPHSSVLVDLLIDNKSLVQALLSADIVYLIDNCHMFQSHETYHHKYTQVSFNHIKNRDLREGVSKSL